MAGKHMGTRQRIVARLSSYWKMEAGSAVVIPTIMYHLTDGEITYIGYFTMVPMVMLLTVGAIYWRCKLLQLTRSDYDAVPFLRVAKRLKPLILVLTVAAVAATILAWTGIWISTGWNDRIVATVASALALLEYVNYYHRQLQHFDNIPDFKRLLSGRGFRRSQMAVDLDAIK